MGAGSGGREWRPRGGGDSVEVGTGVGPAGWDSVPVVLNRERSSLLGLRRGRSEGLCEGCHQECVTEKGLGLNVACPHLQHHTWSPDQGGRIGRVPGRTAHPRWPSGMG